MDIKHNSITQIITGFDSAWTDKQNQPGAIASIVQYKNGECRWMEPRLATFSQAKTIICTLSVQSPFHFVVIDQPIVVPNKDGSRPVDKIAASLISKLKGGVQPANRSKKNMFGDKAPIWKLLRNIPHKQLPWQAHKEVQINQDSVSQKIIAEVFPALALPGLIPSFFARGKCAKYNPANKKNFNIEDWVLICEFIESYAKQNKIKGLSEWARSTKRINSPTKSDQDKLDGAICALIGYQWYQKGTKTNMIIGDVKTGYIITPVTPEVSDILTQSAKLRRVPVNIPWSEEDYGGEVVDIPSTIKTGKQQIGNHSLLTVDSKVKPIKKYVDCKPSDVLNQLVVKNHLIQIALKHETITYGACLEYFDLRCNQGTVGVLTRILDAIADQAVVKNQPNISGLVVNKKEGLPGAGFFKHTNLAKDANKQLKKDVFNQELLKIWDFSW